MVGSYKLVISTNKISYTINIDRAITVISGNSGTGKTTLCKIVSEVIKGSKGYSSNMSDKLYVLDSISPWDIILKTIKKKVVFVDENSKYIYTSEFADLAQKSDNYFVIISRRALDSMTYSYKSIYELQTNKKGNIYETELIKVID